MPQDERQNVCAGQCGDSGLCDCCSELALFDSQHSAQVDLSPELSQIRGSLTTKINRNHDPFINLLPFELASKVFILCVEDDMNVSLSRLLDYSLPQLALKLPLDLGKVCRAWRDIAWATPQLWNKMTLFVRNIPQVSTIDLVNQWLSRSEQLPLCITLILKKFPIMSEDVHESISSLFGAVRNRSHHWRQMQIVGPPHQSETLFRGIDRLPLLESLMIMPRYQPGQILKAVDFRLHNAPLLAIVDFGCLSLQHISLDWTTLTFVRFSCIHRDEILHILRLATGLTGCKFNMINGDYGDYPHPNEMFTHQSLRTLHIQPLTEFERLFSTHFNPFFSEVSFPSLVDFTYDASEDEVPLDILLDLLDRSQCSITHFTLIIRENGGSMDDQNFVLLLTKLQTVTHLSLLNFDTDRCLITNQFFRFLGETRQRDSNIFLPQLQVLKYEGWRSFDWKELADICYCGSTPRSPASQDVASKPHFTAFRTLEFRLYLPDGNVQDHDYIDLEYLPLFKQARVWGTTITIHCNVLKGDVDLDEWEMIDLLQFP